MINHDDDVQPSSEEVAVLAELTEEITRRLEAGEPVEDDCLGDNHACAGPIRKLLPTLQTMVSLGEQIARQKGSRTRLQRKKKGKAS